MVKRKHFSQCTISEREQTIDEIDKKKISELTAVLKKKWFIRKRRISTSAASTTELYIGDPTQTTIHALKVQSQQFRWITR